FHESDSTLGFGHCFVIRAHSDAAAVMVEARINRTPHPGPLPLGRGEGGYPPRATRYKHGAPDGAFARSRSKGEREMAAVARCSLVARHSLFVILLGILCLSLPIYSLRAAQPLRALLITCGWCHGSQSLKNTLPTSRP